MLGSVLGSMDISMNLKGVGVVLIELMVYYGSFPAILSGTTARSSSCLLSGASVKPLRH